MTTELDETQPMLPGLELESSHGAKPAAMRRAVIATLEALDTAGLLEPRHTAMCQLALELADSVTSGRASGRASAAAMAAAQLRDTLLALPSPAAAELSERFDAFVLSLKTPEDVSE